MSIISKVIEDGYEITTYKNGTVVRTRVPHTPIVVPDIDDDTAPQGGRQSLNTGEFYLQLNTNEFDKLMNSQHARVKQFVKAIEFGLDVDPNHPRIRKAFKLLVKEGIFTRARLRALFPRRDD